MTSEAVPFVSLGGMHREIAHEVEDGVRRVLETASFIGGKDLQAFEEAYARYCGASHCVGVANGTDALELALRACGVGPAADVILPANTFVATAEAVVRAGAKVVLADVDEDFLVDPESVRERLTDRTAAAVPVHLYGQMAPMERLAEVVGDGVALVEDAAQSQGASRFGRRSGSVGLAAATSFYPGKNLGAYGDAGAVTTSSEAVAERVRQLGNHGGARKYEHLVVGTNSRLDSIQAVVLSAKLARLDAWNAQRRQAAERYADLLAGARGLRLPRVADGNEHVWHLFVVELEERERVRVALEAAGIGVGIHYPRPVHLLPAFSFLGHGPGDFPVAEAHAGRILSLPMFPGITAQQQARVAEVLLEAL
jgi:dTDP-4-amino-4,6-dideoxygalactose transaminase